MRKRIRSIVRRISRDAQRKHPRYNGPAPRYEPARNDYCPTHWRQLRAGVCSRCPEAATGA